MSSHICIFLLLIDVIFYLRPKTAPVSLDKKPPRTPEKKITKTGGAKVSTGDDWLAELTAKVDEDDEFTKTKSVVRSG